MSLLITLVAIIEVVLFGFLGTIVDWLAETDKATFLEREGDTLMLLLSSVAPALASLP